MVDKLDLRIDNWVYSQVWRESRQIKSIDNTICKIGEHLEDYEHIDGIELTTDILLKCGLEFKKGTISNSTAVYADFDQYRIYTNGGENSIHFNVDGGFFPTIRNIKYLHEFQNWYYFTLTHELVINL